jgi:hypothetical protein
MAEEPKVREEYLKKIEQIRKGNFLRFNSMEEFYRHYKNKNA